jgi:beta-lactamase superfamily II metal-dependent hydrolase
MSIIKSFSVGNGDMFYINHRSESFTIIDCSVNEANAERILNEIKAIRTNKKISRFISTHPDEDHIHGIELLEKIVGIENFYCVRNSAKKTDETVSFQKYCDLRDSEEAFYIYKGCSRKWMNKGDDERGSSGINILWPDVNNSEFKAALSDAANGYSPNNISPIIKYSLNGGASFLWMGDLETDFMESVENELNLMEIDILFAPHHGRKSGKIPLSILEKLNPKIIVVGEAPSEHLHYYTSCYTITQNSAGDIVFCCQAGKVHIFTSESYEVDFLDDENMQYNNMNYLGTLNL